MMLLNNITLSTDAQLKLFHKKVDIVVIIDNRMIFKS